MDKNRDWVVNTVRIGFDQLKRGKYVMKKTTRARIARGRDRVWELEETGGRKNWCNQAKRVKTL